jgi:hypothetical protein
MAIKKASANELLLGHGQRAGEGNSAQPLDSGLSRSCCHLVHTPTCSVTKWPI